MNGRTISVVAMADRRLIESGELEKTLTLQRGDKQTIDLPLRLTEEQENDLLQFIFGGPVQADADVEPEPQADTLLTHEVAALIREQLVDDDESGLGQL